MKQKLVKIITIDNIELTGLLYTPIKETKKIVVHVHGLAGNFYENSFIDFQAKNYTENGYGYFVFNNRGNGYFTDLIKKEDGTVTYINGGAAFELFEDSYLDIDSAINYVFGLGYEDIILQGHSYGCNKVINYYLKNKSDKIKNIILLAPCDINSEFKLFINDFDAYIQTCKDKVNNNQVDEVVFSNLFPSMAFSAKTVVNDFLEDVSADIFRYRNKDYISDNLKSINIPVLVQIGSNDNNVLIADKSDIIQYLNNNFNELELIFIDNTDHGYIEKEQEMSNNCIIFLKNNNK